MPPLSWCSRRALAADLQGGRDDPVHFGVIFVMNLDWQRRPAILGEYPCPVGGVRAPLSLIYRASCRLLFLRWQRCRWLRISGVDALGGADTGLARELPMRRPMILFVVSDWMAFGTSITLKTDSLG